MMNIHLIRTKNVSNELYAKVFDLILWKLSYQGSYDKAHIIDVTL